MSILTLKLRARLALGAVTVAAAIVGVPCGPLAWQQAPALPPSGDALVAAALIRAKAEHKTVFIDFGASWCGPCGALHRFLDEPAPRAILDKYFVHVSLTVQESGARAALNTPGAEGLLGRWNSAGGIPFSVFLDASGGQRAKAVGFGGAAFVETLRKATSRLTEPDRAALLDYFGGSRRLAFGVTSTHLVWDDPSGSGSRAAVSHDGRYVAYVPSLDENVVLHDVLMNSDRPLGRAVDPASKVPWATDLPAFSKDDKWLAYSWREKGVRSQLHIVPVEGPGTDQPRVLVDDKQITWIGAGDWSPDGTWIAVAYAGADDVGHVGVVSTSDGSLRGLKSFKSERLQLADWTDDNGNQLKYTIAISPDGRFLAFDLREATNYARDVLVLALDTGREFPAAVRAGDDALVGWSPDGGSLLYTSDRAGTIDLWVAPFRGGAFEAPTLVKQGVGELVPLGLSTSGALYHQVVSRDQITIQTAPFDFGTGQVLAAPADAAHEVLQWAWGIAWSTDGTQLAYVRGAASMASSETIGILSTESGQVRTLFPRLRGIYDLRPRTLAWLPGDGALALIGAGFDGRDGLFRIDASGGALSFVTAGNWARRWSPDGKVFVGRPAGNGSKEAVLIRRDLGTGLEQAVFRAKDASEWQISPDGRTLYYLRSAARDSGTAADLVARDLSSNTERTLLPLMRGASVSTVSPNGRWVVASGNDPATGQRFDLLVPTAGGDARTMPYVGQLGGARRLLWAPDSRSYITMALSTAYLRKEWWWIPLDGRDPRKLELGPGQVLELAPNPRGDRLAIRREEETKSFSEIWAMDVRFPASAVSQQTSGRTHVTWSLGVAPNARAVAGGVFDATIAAKIDAGWHVYSMLQAPNGPSALLVDLPEDSPFSLAGSIVESTVSTEFDPNFSIETHVFEKTATLTVPVRIARGTATGLHKLRMSVGYQTCSARLCLPPATVDLDLDIAVVAGIQK